MAYAVEPGDILRMNIFTKDGDQLGMMTHWRLVNQVNGTGQTDVQIATEYDSVIESYIKPMINNNATYLGVAVQVLAATGWQSPKYIGTHQGAGTAGATALPRQVCGFINMKTDLAGRRFRGRQYFPFPATAHDTGNGVPSGAYITLLTTYAADCLLNYLFFGTSPNTVLAPLVIYHRAGKTPIPAPTPVVSVTMPVAWATQRRRGSFGRINSDPFA